MLNDMTKMVIEYPSQLLDNIQEGILVISFDGNVIYQNRKALEIFGVPIKEISGFDFVANTLNIERAALDDIIKCISEGQIWHKEQRITIDGQEKALMYRINLHMAEGLPPSIILISTDITELVDAREKAEAANMTKNQFLANMSHEIRTPMIGILGSVDLLEQSDISAEQAETVGIIKECGEHLLTLINDILDVSKIEIGLVDIHSEPCNLHEVFNKTVNIIDPMVKDKGLSLDLKLDPVMPVRVTIDHIRLRQILLNILYNSIKFTNKGGIKIMASIECGDDLLSYLIVSIKDTGVGIAKNQIPRIFDPFTQGDNSSSREFGGTGLGLYTCKKFTKLMGGDIWLESAIARGTTFHLRIPLEVINDTGTKDKKAHPVSPPPVADESAALMEFNPIKVLLVEDNNLNSRIVNRMLSNYGFDVTTVFNGLECLRIMLEKHYDIILMDMQMPIMDGYETTRIIRENQNNSNIPVIAITAHTMTGDSDKCLACGCNEYISKPFKTEDLVQLINKTLAKSSIAEINRNLLANELITELLPEFLPQLAEMINDLDRAVYKQDIKAIQSTSHDIKGTCGLYGFVKISELAALIEQAARENAFSKIRTLAIDLSFQYQQLYTQVS